MEEDGGYQYGLPDECWERIFARLSDDYCDIQAISLVSKQFLLISNRLKLSLKVSDPTISLLPQLLQRFDHLKSIDIYTDYDQDIDGIIQKISWSGTKLEELQFSCEKSPSHDGFLELALNMKSTLKVLECADLSSLQDTDLVLIANLFPCLEELSIGGYITDYGIEVLASKLNQKLKRIALYSKSFITDRSLVSLSSNCVNMREISIYIFSSHEITQDGIGFVMRNSSLLTSLSFGSMQIADHLFDRSRAEFLPDNKPVLHPLPMFTIENSITFAKNLHTLSIRQFMYISPELLCSIAKAHPSLKKLNLFEASYNFPTFQDGLPLLLQASQSTLKELTLTDRSLTDSYMTDLSKYLHNLTYINLDTACILSSATFYTLTNNCPLLEEITMTFSQVDDDADTLSPDLFRKNYSMRRLNLMSSTWLRNPTLKYIGRVCPNLQYLDVSYCPLTDAGVGEILESCLSIEHLKVDGLKISNIFGSYSPEKSVVNLKTLSVRGTHTNDEAMGIIGNRCPDLRCLDIGRCKKVTSNGVKEVVRKCRRLREMHMMVCNNVSLSILPWMVLSRPSLSKITPPKDLVPTEQLRNLFLCFGCWLLDGKCDTDHSNNVE